MLGSPTNNNMVKIDPLRVRYPFCVVFTPIPFLTYVVLQYFVLLVCKRNFIILFKFSGGYFHLLVM